MNLRPAATTQDIEQALDIAWMNELGIDPSERPAVIAHWRYLLASCPEGFWVAEDGPGGSIIGIASAVRRPPLWILNNFYVHPDFHGRGIGKALLQKAFDCRDGCNRSLVHASSHPSAQALYLQFGMRPQPYSILFKAPPAAGPGSPSRLDAGPHPLDAILPVLQDLDLNTLGYARPADHRLWAENGAYFLVRDGSRTVGYFRTSPDGYLGPLVAADERWIEPILDWAIYCQHKITGSRHELFVPGANQAAIGWLLARGYRFHELNLMMCSHPMPGLARVVFHDMDLL